MELRKANLHMDQIKCQINTQITLEEDKNISDRNPDASHILIEKGKVIIEDIRPGKDVLNMKGKMVYEILYAAEGEEEKLYRMQGEIDWEEKVHVDGMENIDTPQVTANLEDLRSNLINSRKINIRGLINFCIQTKEIRDREILLDILEEDIEVKKEPYTQSVIAVDQKDIFRIKEDLELPASLPAVGEVLWTYLDLGKWEIRPLENNIGIQGELNLFLLYESSGENAEIKSYETVIPFSGNLECPGSNSCMVADITPTVSSSGVNVKRDYDGEDRLLEVEMVLEVPIQIYEKRDIEQITDIYSTSWEMVPEYEKEDGKLIRDKYQSRLKISENLKLPASGGRVLQICHINAKVFIEDSQMEKEGIAMEGILSLLVLYMSDRENKKYEVIKKEIPFTHEIGNLNITSQCKWKIIPMVENCQGVVLDESSVEVKTVIGLEILIQEEWKSMSIKNVKTNPLSDEVMNNMPGIVVYFPQKKESLWEIGKKYSISQEAIKKVNQLEGNEIEKGQKILLIK